MGDGILLVTMGTRVGMVSIGAGVELVTMGTRVGMVTMGDWVGNKYIPMICLKPTQPPKLTIPPTSPTPQTPLLHPYTSNTTLTPLPPLHRQTYLGAYVTQYHMS